MRRIGIHLSYWQENWSEDLLPIITKARDAGFDGAEFPLLQTKMLDFPRLRAALDDAGMLATCSTGLTLATDITSPDPGIRKAGITHLRTCLEGAAVLGSRILGGVTYAPWNFFPADQLVDRRRKSIQSLKLVGGMAADLGITLCVEVINRFEGFLLNTVETAECFLDEVDHPNVLMQLDTFHLNIEEANLEEAILRAGTKIGHFHCSENHRGQPGTGHIPWYRVLSALNEVDYQGWLVIESFVQAGGEVGRDLYIWNGQKGDVDSMAQQGAQFLRQIGPHD